MVSFDNFPILNRWRPKDINKYHTQPNVTTTGFTPWYWKFIFPLGITLLSLYYLCAHWIAQPSKFCWLSGFQITHSSDLRHCLRSTSSTLTATDLSSEPQYCLHLLYFYINLHHFLHTSTYAYIHIIHYYFWIHISNNIDLSIYFIYSYCTYSYCTHLLHHIEHQVISDQKNIYTHKWYLSRFNRILWMYQTWRLLYVYCYL